MWQYGWYRYNANLQIYFIRRIKYYEPGFPKLNRSAIFKSWQSKKRLKPDLLIYKMVQKNNLAAVSWFLLPVNFHLNAYGSFSNAA